MSDLSNLFSTAPTIARKIIDPLAVFQKLPPQTRNWPLGLVAIILVGIVLLAPVPRASNHPLAWMLWATILGMTATFLLVQPQARTVVPSPAQVMISMGIIWVGFGIFQAMPLPALRGGLVIELPPGPIILSSLSIAPTATLLAAIRTASYIIFFWLALRAAHNPVWAKRMGYGMFYGIAVHGALAYLALKVFGDTSFIAPKTAFFGMATGTFVNKNSFATFLGMGLVLGLALCFGTGKKSAGQFRQRIDLAALIIILIALIYTQSRMGIAASLLAGLLVLLSGIKRYGPVLAIFLIAGITMALSLDAPFFDLSRSGASRLMLYKQVFAMIQSRPLTGFGMDSFALGFEMFHSPGVTAGMVWDKAHSTYLTLWCEGGILFGSLPLIAGLYAGLHLWRRTRIQQPGQSLARAGVGALTLVGLHSLVDFSLEIPANTFLLLAIIALGLAPHRPSKGTS